MSDHNLLSPLWPTLLYPDAAMAQALGTCLKEIDPLRRAAGRIPRGAGR